MGFPTGEVFRVAGAAKNVIGVAGGLGPVEGPESFLAGLSEIGKKHDVVVQAFDAASICGKSHLVHAARAATLAQERGGGFANSLAMELICWVAAERQIGPAIKKVGIKKGQENLAFVAVGGSESGVVGAFEEIFASLGIEPNMGVLAPNSEKEKTIKKIFSTTEEEIEIAPLEKIVLERVSLLGAQL